MASEERHGLLGRLARVARLARSGQNRQNIELLHNIIDAIGDPIFVKDGQFRFVVVNRALCDFTGLRREQFIGLRDADLFPRAQAEVFQQRDALVLRTGQSDIHEETLHRADGSLRIIRTTKTTFSTQRGSRVLVGIFTDLTDLRTAQAELESANSRLRLLSHCDPLTGLPNRRAFEEQLGRQIAHSNRCGESFAVLFLDLNGFKQVNDTYGHQAGDELIQAIGSRVAAEARAGDFTARLGGDEFVVIAHATGETEAARLAERLAHAVAQPVRLQATELWVTVSIGIARFPLDGADHASLVRNADSAMYRAKRTTHLPYEFHDAQQSEIAKRRYLIECQLAKDLAAQAIGAHFQPICSLEDSRVVGYEALARWNHATLGPIAPDEFIQIAEEVNSIVRLGEQVLRQACRFIATRGTPGQYVAVNVSNRQVQDAGFVDMVWRVLEETGATPGQLALELTESALCADDAPRVLGELRTRGVAVFIDDFGVGYSNLTRLHQLSFDAIKVDRGFISDIELGGVATAMIRTIVMLAGELRVRLIAEGIERPQQTDALKSAGLLYGQGYLFGRPQAAEHWTGGRVKTTGSRPARTSGEDTV